MLPSRFPIGHFDMDRKLVTRRVWFMFVVLIGE